MPTLVSELPELEYLRECFDYSILTGDLWWKERPREHFKSVSAWKTNTIKFAGEKAGFIIHGYLAIKINGKRFMLHRVLYKLITEQDPPRYVDHIDGDKLNNAWQNLRDVSHEDNLRNQRLRVTNSTGFKGVSKAGNRYTASIHCNKKEHLGYFDTPEEAHAAYCEAALKYHGEFANLGQ